MLTSFEDRSELYTTVILTVAGFALTIVMLIAFTYSATTHKNTDDHPSPDDFDPPSRVEYRN